LAGCPLLLMLWSFERFDIGRPRLRSYEPYEEAMYHLDDDGYFDPMAHHGIDLDQKKCEFISISKICLLK